jgi:hypothetical protein
MGCDCLAKLGEDLKKEGRLNAILFPVELIRNTGLIYKTANVRLSLSQL